MSDQILGADNDIPESTCFSLGNRQFLFDLAAFNKHSNYFRDSTKFQNYFIDLLQEFKECAFYLDDELISDFIDHCNDKHNIEINIEKIYTLYALAKKFNVIDLIMLIEAYISENKGDFVNFIFSISKTHDISNYEHIFSKNLKDYVFYDQLSLYPISTLYRILYIYHQDNDILENPEIIDFLIKIISKQGQDALILLSIFKSLINNHYFLEKLSAISDLINFELINKIFNVEGVLLSEIVALQQQQIGKDEEIKLLKEEISQLKSEKSVFAVKTEHENDIQNLREEISLLKEEIKHFSIKTKQEEEIKNLREEINLLKEENKLIVKKTEQKKKKRGRTK